MYCKYDQDSLVHFAVEVNNAVVQSKPVDGSDEKFRPWTPGQVALF